MFRTDRSVIRHNQDWSGVEKLFFPIFSRSTGPISAIFFCCDEDDELYPTKKDRWDRITGSRDNFFRFGSGRVGSRFLADPIWKFRTLTKIFPDVYQILFYYILLQLKLVITNLYIPKSGYTELKLPELNFYNYLRWI